MVPWLRPVGAVVVLSLAAVGAAVAVWPAAPVSPAPLENGSAIADAHAAELESAGGFTYRDTTRIRVNGTLETNRTTVARFDTDGAALVERRSDRVGRMTVYGDGAGSSYERHDPSVGPVRYGQPLQGATQVSRYRNPGIAPLVGDIEYTYQGTTRVDGIRVHEYAATTPEQVEGVVGADATGPAIDTTVDVRVFVSGDGVVRRMRITVEQRDGSRTRTLNSTLAYTAVGGTTVPEPDWVPAARNRTGPSR